MNLWTEYEGRTVAGDYYLETLLRSEGRSAFFKTRGKTDKDEVIRLTEAHFDEDEMLKRWRQVAAVDQSNLIEIRKVGQTTFDGVALAYALLEPSDASLAEVLQERPLTTTETLQVAKAVVAALTVLHSNGLVHEHIEPANVLAVDETVKLRSDCVRPCVVDMEFSTAEDCAALRRNDIRDLGLLLLQCLALVKEWRPTLALAAPFNQLIPGAIDGTWDLERMAAALDPPARALPKPPITATNGRPIAAPMQAAPAASASTVVKTAEPRASLVPDSVLQKASAPASAQAVLFPEQDEIKPATHFRARNDVGLLQRDRSAIPLWAFYVAAVVLVVFLGWLLFGRSSKPAVAKVPASAAASSASAASSATGATAVAARSKPSAARPMATRVVVPNASSAASSAGWHVVAYTYNYQNQAAAKADQLRKAHASMQPQVFSPSGHAPFFVALGGAMSKQDAASALQRARRSDLPRDTFMRNY